MSAKVTSNSSSALFVAPSSNKSTKPATYAPTTWYAKRAHAHFATYFGAGAYGVNG
jgi:hypothetical protein